MLSRSISSPLSKPGAQTSHLRQVHLRQVHLLRLILTLAAFAAVLTPLAAQAAELAHVKWFTQFSFADRPRLLQEVASPLFFGLTALSMVVIGLLVPVDRGLRKLHVFQRIENWLELHKGQSTLIMRMAMGATFLLAWQGDAMLAPDLKLSLLGPLGPTIGWAEFFLALLLIFPQTTPVAGFGLLGLYGYGISHFGVFYMLDYVHFAGIAIYLLLSQVENLRLSALRLPVLYATVGFALSWVALEKIIYPEWALYLLQQNPQLSMGLPVNFFLLSAAFVEFSLGYLLIICLFERPLALIITLVFFTTTLVFGKIEVVGHTALHAALIIFLLNGPGTVYRAPITFHQKLPLRTAFAAVNFAVILAVMLVAYSTGAWNIYQQYTAGLPRIEVSAATAPSLRLHAEGSLLYIDTGTYNGHVHLYVDGDYLASTAVGETARTYDLSALPAGTHRVAATLHDHDHRFVTVSGELVSAQQLVTVN